MQPIVEGHGEVEAVPVLLRRLLGERGCYDVDVASPIRKPRSKLLKRDGLEQAVKVARIRKPGSWILVLFDADDDCPADLSRQLENWISEFAADLNVIVAIAMREFEAWFLAGIEPLRGRRGILADPAPPLDPESFRDAKGRLEALMGHGESYLERTDQPAFAANFDTDAAYRECRSFRHLVDRVDRMLEELANRDTRS